MSNVLIRVDRYLAADTGPHMW